MPQAAVQTTELSPLKRALLTLDKMQARIDALEGEKREPIAVIGIGCRFPGGSDSPDAYWRLFTDRVDAVKEVPADRWSNEAFFDPDPDAPGKMASRWGGFIDHVDQFDPVFFGISPREARQMDPQQRLLLQIAYEALERAGQPLEALVGSETGVFVGLHSFSSDYALMQCADLDGIDTYTGTGTAHSLMANRISYLFDLRGPSISLDTACSSSTVAVHLAVRSLRNRECRMALAGGVNMMLTPEPSVAFSHMRMMAPDGRCKTFDASADGFVRGEGGGVVVLKRLSDAIADNDPILAVVRGSAVNQDGRTNGITAPNGLSQQRVLQEAIRDAGVEPAEIVYIETHGTGTSLGDPIEVEALAEVLGRAGDRPCVLGAAKTNIGHLEGAAGIAGFIKAVLCLQHGYVPPNLHFTSLNPHISLEGTRLSLPGEGVALDEKAGLPCAGTSGFGFGGTNAHVILQAWRPETETEPETDTEPETPAARPEAWLLPLSAQTEAALADLARSYHALLAAPSGLPSLDDIGYTTARRRTHFDERLALVGRDREEMIRTLDRFLANEPDDNVVRGHREPGRRPGLAFVFSGQGGQWAGMGRELLEHEPVFREAVEACDALFEPLAGWSLRDVLTDERYAERYDQTEIVQPALFALQVGLAAFWASKGITPDAIVGHSVGEVAAAYVAGALTLEDAVRVIYHRGRLIQQAGGLGKMAAVGVSADEAERLIADYRDQVSVAAVNGPASTVLSGDEAVLKELLASLEARGVFCRMLLVDYPSHCPQMEPFRHELVAALQGIRPRATRVPLYSTVEARVIRGDALGADYWGRNIRQTVLFAPAVEALIRDGLTSFLEIGPHPVLGYSIVQCLDEQKTDGAVTGSIRREEPARVNLTRALGHLYTQGVPVDWQTLYPGRRRPVALPAYPWQNRRFWIDTDAHKTAPHRSRSSRVPGRGDAGRLGDRIDASVTVFERTITAEAGSLLADHRLYDTPVVPASYLLDLFEAAGAAELGAGAFGVEAFSVDAPMALSLSDPYFVQTVVVPDGAGGALLRLSGRPAGPTDADAPWVLHASCRLRPVEAGGANGAEPGPGDAFPADGTADGDGASFYQGLDTARAWIGPRYRGVRRVLRRGREVWVEVAASGDAGDAGGQDEVRAAGVEACLHGGKVRPGEDVLYRIVGVERTDVLQPGAVPVRSRLRFRDEDEAQGTADAWLYDAAGRVTQRLVGIRFERAGDELEGKVRRTDPNEWVYQVDWHAGALDAPAGVAGAMPDPGSVASALAPEVLPLRTRLGLDVFQRLRPRLDALCTGYIVEALAALGEPLEPNTRFTTGALADRLGVVDRYRRLFDRLLDILAEEEIVRREDGGWRVVARPESVDLAKAWDDLAGAFPECDAELVITRRCAEHLADVLRGDRDPLGLLFPDGSSATAARLYREAPFSQSDNALVRETLRGIVDRLPGTATLRILEVGAGTGGTTSYLLDAVPAGRTRYTFTDVSAYFLEQAREQFAGRAELDYRVLDIEQDVAAQGFEPGAYDVVVASNVYHATEDLRRTLRNARKLLAPGGLFIVQEVTRPQRWADLVFGLTEGWWRFRDTELRPSYPLLAPERWLTVLEEAGFEAPVDVSGGAEARAVRSEQSVLLARQPAGAPADASGAACWVLFGDRGGVADALATRLRAAGTVPVLVEAGSGYEAVAADHYRIDPAVAGHYPRVLTDVGARHGACLGVVYLWSLDETSPLETISMHETEPVFVAGTQGALYVSQALVGREDAGRLWLVTRGAQHVSGDGDAGGVVSLVQAPLWGLGRSVAHEHPDRWGRLVDLDVAASPADSAALLAAELYARPNEDQVAYRGGTRYLPRLSRGTAPAVAFQGFDPKGAYLVTGGLGGLGLQVARWMADRGARHLILIGRTPLPPRDTWDDLVPGEAASEKVAAIRSLEALGVRVETHALDVGDADAMEALLGTFGRTAPPLRGIMHTAAVVDIRPLDAIDPEALKATFRSKVQGTWLLHRLTESMDLDFFVLFSSVAALIGMTAHYAAANTFMDVLAGYRRARGLAATSINWGAWESIQSVTETDRQVLHRMGYRPMAFGPVFDLLGRLLVEAPAHLAVAYVNWSQLKTALEIDRPRSLLKEIDRMPARLENAVADAPSEQSLETRLRQAAPDDRRPLLIRYLQDETRAVLGLAPEDAVNEKQGFFEMGMDSLMAMDFRRRLQEALDRPLPSTLLFNYTSVERLTTYLLDEVLETGSAPDAAASVPAGTAPTVPAPAADDDLETLSNDELADLLDKEVASLLGDNDD